MIDNLFQTQHTSNVSSLECVCVFLAMLDFAVEKQTVVNPAKIMQVMQQHAKWLSPNRLCLFPVDDLSCTAP